ncbi:MAG TPA: hypothetical protein DEA08_33235 [Planctomycetes bacterium]|nr:hypothetical protein [Planctomycetota bacterium]
MKRPAFPLATAGCGLALIALYAALDLSGWADAVSVLSGTPAPGVDPLTGLAYMTARLAAWIVAPILLLAAVLQPLLLRLPLLAGPPQELGS